MTLPVTATSAAAAAAATTTPRTSQTPAGVVRTISTSQPAACATTVQHTIHARVSASAAGSPGTAPTDHEVSASSITAWTDQARFSGAVRTAPRWSAAGDTGNATICSRGSSCRPPAPVAAATTTPTRKNSHADGVSRTSEGTRSRG